MAMMRKLGIFWALMVGILLLTIFSGSMQTSQAGSPASEVTIITLEELATGVSVVTGMEIDSSGRVDDQFQIPADVAVAVAGAARAVAVSESPARPLQRVIDEALEAESPPPRPRTWPRRS